MSSTSTYVAELVQVSARTLSTSYVVDLEIGLHRVPQVTRNNLLLNHTADGLHSAQHESEALLGAFRATADERVGFFA